MSDVWHVNEYQSLKIIVDRDSHFEAYALAHNAPLVAAAPELLASLEEFVELYEGTVHMLGTSVKAKLERAQHAITKAKTEVMKP